MDASSSSLWLPPRSSGIAAPAPTGWPKRPSTNLDLRAWRPGAGSRAEIDANAVAPGFTRTDANAAPLRESSELGKGLVEAQIAPGRFGEPSEIAAVVAFVVWDEGHSGDRPDD